MTYGIRIYNADGDVIIDDQDFSLSGSEIQNTDIFGSYATTPFLGPVSIEPEELLFQKLEIGQSAFFGLIIVPGGADVVVSPDRDFFISKPYNEIDEPDFGITVRNSLGEPTFHSGGLLVAVKNTFNVFIPAGAASLPVDVAVESTSNFFAVTSAVSGLAAISANLGIQFAPVLTRTSSTNVRVEVQAVGDGPPVSPPASIATHFSFLEARVA